MKNNLSVEQKPPVQTLIVAPYLLIQQSLKNLIQENQAMMVIDYHSSFDELLENQNIILADVVILYLIDEKFEIIDYLSKLRNISQNIRVLIISPKKEALSFNQMIQKIPFCLVENELNSKSILIAIQKIMNEEYVSNSSMLPRSSNGNGKSNHQNGFKLQNVNDLTSQEQELIKLIGKGSKNAEIATKLSLSEESVQKQVMQIYQKLGVKDRLNLVITAFQKGLLSSSNVSLM